MKKDCYLAVYFWYLLWQKLLGFSNLIILLTDVMLVVFLSGVVKRRAYDYHVEFVSC